jgi:hypothetical protein
MRKTRLLKRRTSPREKERGENRLRSEDNLFHDSHLILIFLSNGEDGPLERGRYSFVFRIGIVREFSHRAGRMD